MSLAQYAECTEQNCVTGYSCCPIYSPFGPSQFNNKEINLCVDPSEINKVIVPGNLYSWSTYTCTQATVAAAGNKPAARVATGAKKITAAISVAAVSALFLA